MGLVNNDSVYNDYYKAIKRDESSVIINSAVNSGAQVSQMSNGFQQTVCANNEETTPEALIPSTSNGNGHHDYYVCYDQCQRRPYSLDVDIRRPTLTLTTPNGDNHYLKNQLNYNRQQQSQPPLKKCDIEVVMTGTSGTSADTIGPIDRSVCGGGGVDGSSASAMGGPLGAMRDYMSPTTYTNQYYTRLIAQQNDAEEKYYYNNYERQYEFSGTYADLVRDLRWIQWRMTLFVFYWIVWFIGLILVIIVVAYRAKV